MAQNTTAHTSSLGWLGLVGGAILGSVWGPSGFGSQWTPLLLAAKFYCFHYVSRAWETGGWVSLPSEAPCFILHLPCAKSLSLPVEPDPGMLRASEDTGRPEHQGAFPFSQEDLSRQGRGVGGAGRGGEASSFGDWKGAKNPKALLFDIAARSASPHGFWRGRCSCQVPGFKVATRDCCFA